MANDFNHRIAASLEDDLLRATLTRSTGILRHNRQQAFADTTPFSRLQAEAQALRQAALGRLPDLLTQLDEEARALGVQVYWADDANAANRYVLALAEARRARQVARSHAAIAEEIGLDAALAAAGVAVVLSDIGDYIVRLSDDTSSHLVFPALHRRKEAVASLFEDKLDVPQTLDIQALTGIARVKLRRPLLEAAMSISDVTLAVAETGTLVLSSDSGSSRLASSVAPIHVAIMGIEQVTASLSDLGLLLPLYARSATGQPLNSTITLLNGPAAADSTVDGPREVHLIILDNGRSDLMRWGYGEALTCIRCGACQNSCPVYREIGGHAYSEQGSGPIGSVIVPLLPVAPVPTVRTRLARTLRLPAAAATPENFGPRPLALSPPLRTTPFADLPRASTLCGACQQVCPVGINIPRLLLRLRADLAQAGRSGVGEQMARRTYRASMLDAGRYRQLRTWLRSASVRGRRPQPAVQSFRERWQARRGT